MIRVTVVDEQDDLKIDPAQVERLVRETLKFEGGSYQEVSLIFANEKTTCQLHADFFQDPTLTDCMSFPIDPPAFLGDVVVCPKAAFIYVEKHGGEVNYEVSLYIVHGILHLMGYRDIEEEERQIMQQAEKKHMENLQSKQLLLH